MTTLLRIFARGAMLVCLVSLNTRLVSEDRWIASVVVAALISAVWWINARSASRVDGVPALLAYSAGAGFGTAVGLWIARLI